MGKATAWGAPGDSPFGAIDTMEETAIKSMRGEKLRPVRMVGRGQTPLAGCATRGNHATTSSGSARLGSATRTVPIKSLV
jgi:hypothetical protein